MFKKDISGEELAISPARPVSPNARIDSIDVLRGIAILGVLIAYVVWNLGSPPPETYGRADQVLNFVLATFLNTKAYTLLAFLFGLGFSIQLTRAKERGVDIVPIFRRRLLALMTIGIVHSLLLRNGDILVPYATMGFVLLFFRNASSTVLFAGGIIGSALPFVARWLWELSGVPFPDRPETTGMSHLSANLLWTKYWYSTAITLWPEMIPIFLFGLFVGRKRVMENLSAHRKTLLRVAVAGLIGGAAIYAGRLVLIGLIEWPESRVHPLRILLQFSWNVHAWGFAAFYGAALLMLMQRRRVQEILRPLAAVGRMSLTNYLLQSIVIVPICIAFDLYDTIKPGFGLLLALGVALLQIPISVLWLSYFRFGPVEWLWRSITYDRVQPMRRGIADPSIQGAMSAAK